MIEAIRKAVPTEYDGVVYRSKTEAIFARALTKLGARFEYEPEIATKFWTPDFLIENWEGVSFVVELKPSAPTKTYIERIAEEWAFTEREWPLIGLAVNPFLPEPHREWWGLWWDDCPDAAL